MDRGFSRRTLPALAGMYRSCELVAACQADGDCPGIRSCVDGICTVGECEDDPLDNATLVHQTYTGLVLCDEDTDSIFVEHGANESLRVSLRHDPAVGDLRLDINTTEVGNALLASSDGPHGLEVIELGPTGGDRTLRLTVSGRPGYNVPYSLSIEELPDEHCPADAYEGLLGNDDLEQLQKRE